jgi:hypothetical protein
LEKAIPPLLQRPPMTPGVSIVADRNSTPIEAARYGSAGNLHSTAKDYAKFLIEIIDPKPPDAFRLSAASLHEMLRPQVKVISSS